MNKSTFIAILVILISLFTVACEENTESETRPYGQSGTVASYVNYDVETLISENTISNGTDRMLARFAVYTLSDYPELYLKGITFKLTGTGNTEDKELGFYNALDNFYFYVNGERVSPIQETATTVVLQPMVAASYPSVVIEVYVANVNASMPELTGHITIEKVIFGDTNQVGYDTQKVETTWDPYLGMSNATAIIDFIDGWQMANWQRANITIINDNIELEEVAETVYYDMETTTPQVSLQNGVNQSIASFLLFVESDRTDLHLKQINFRLRGNGYTGEAEELEFYDALDNFKIIVNGQEIDPIESATTLYPQFDIPINEITSIEIKADVLSTMPEVHGYISIERIFITHPKEDGTGEKYPENLIFNPGLGNGYSTAMSLTYDNGAIPSWDFPSLTITTP